MNLIYAKVSVRVYRPTHTHTHTHTHIYIYIYVRKFIYHSVCLWIYIYTVLRINKNTSNNVSTKS